MRVAVNCGAAAIMWPARGATRHETFGQSFGRRHQMLLRIPSWAVAVVGASIVIVATATSSTLLHQTRTGIISAQSEIAEIRRGFDRQWSNHLQADQRSTAADSFLAQALGSSAGQSFLLGQAAYQLRGAVLSMWAAATAVVMPVRRHGAVAEVVSSCLVTCSAHGCFLFPVATGALTETAIRSLPPAPTATRDRGDPGACSCRRSRCARRSARRASPASRLPRRAASRRSPRSTRRC